MSPFSCSSNSGWLPLKNDGCSAAVSGLWAPALPDALIESSSSRPINSHSALLPDILGANWLYYYCLNDLAAYTDQIPFLHCFIPVGAVITWMHMQPLMYAHSLRCRLGLGTNRPPATPKASYPHALRLRRSTTRKQAKNPSQRNHLLLEPVLMGDINTGYINSRYSWPAPSAGKARHGTNRCQCTDKGTC